MLQRIFPKFSRYPLLSHYVSSQPRVERQVFSYLFSRTNSVCAASIPMIKDEKERFLNRRISQCHVIYVPYLTRTYSSVRERRDRKEATKSSPNENINTSNFSLDVFNKNKTKPRRALQWESLPPTLAAARERGEEDMRVIFWSSTSKKWIVRILLLVVLCSAVFIILKSVMDRVSLLTDFKPKKDDGWWSKWLGIHGLDKKPSSKGGLFSLFYQTTPQFATNVDVKFSDVKGCDEAKEELQLVVNFLRDPKRFSRLGARLPKGVLLEGPPGVGKTLLAKAVAGEANVNYLYAAGSEFDEIFVGVGASRIRTLFKEAQTYAPCVIFIDEFDSVGSQRVSSTVSPYANQTINQLLTEMDGFKPTQGIIVLAATNRKDHLDKAVLRPGRFDLHINISPPDLAGRVELFKLYLSKVKADPESIRVERLAAGTAGFTGADIKNMVNQAAIQAGLTGREHVILEDLWHARDKILMGAAKKRIPDAEVNKLTAYHEAGHSLVGIYTPESIPLHKVTIIPRGHAGGLTSFLPEKDIYHMSKEQLLARLDTGMGGRVAEELIFGPENVTTGAVNDFQHVTEIAESMVKLYGMSEKLGPRTFVSNSKESAAALGPSTRALIDDEVKRILNESYERAKKILIEHSHELDLLAEGLLKYETLEKEDVLLVIKGEKPKHAVELSIKLDDPQLNPHSS